MVARPWSFSRLSCGERLLLRCDGNAGNSFPNTQGKDPSSGARRRKRGSSGCGRDSRASSRVENFKPRIDSHHGGTWDSPVGKPRGKDSWESLVGKPRGKATDTLIHATGTSHCCYSSGGKRTCMPPLETRTDSPGDTPEVPQDPCQHWRGILRFRHRIHTRS